MINNIFLQKSQYREDFFSDDFLKENISITKKISIIAVVHLIDTGVPYINTLNRFFDLQAIIPKPKTINNELMDNFPKEKILNIKREEINDSYLIENILDKIPKGNKIVLLDIGGYFSFIGNDIAKKYNNSFLGIIEDTENGYQKYKKQTLAYPLISVARSSLKECEDFLVGQSIVFSSEGLLREQGILMSGKSIGIIGIGKLGNGILSNVKNKSALVSVFDNDPQKMVVAHSKGALIKDKLNLLRDSDFIFLATGNMSLANDDYKYLKKGSFLFSVTSADDEIDSSWLKREYSVEILSKYIKKYKRKNDYFYMVNDCNAVNFIHGAVVDDFILLVQKEMLDSIIDLAQRDLPIKIYDGFKNTKDRITSSWLKKFLGLTVV